MKLLVQRYVSALAIVLVAFSAYALLAVPRLEPQVKLREQAEDGARPRTDTGQRLLRNRQRLRHLFAEGSWQLAEPKVLETEHGTLLFKDYRPLEDGRMELKPLTLILNTGKAASGTRPATTRPMILDAPEGAVLQFDAETDPARADFGRLTGGLLAGEIKISSPATTPAGNDALSIVTRNVQLDERRVWTPHAVQFRYGPSYGSGRDLVITLVPPDKDGGPRSGPSFEGIKSLELVHLDKLHLESTGDSLLPGKRRDKAAAAPGEPKPPPAPVEITCQGPFLFDFVERVASFEDHVDVIRLNPDGPSDQLNCQLLAIHFQGDANEAKSEPPAQQMRMEVDRVVAVGHPVVLRAPSMGATARGERLEYHLASRRIVLEDRDRVMLLDERFDIEARQLEYEMAAAGGLGRLWAAGPGRLRARKVEPAKVNTAGARGPRAPIAPIASRPDATAPATLEATWKKELRLRPYKGQHVVSLLEEATVGVVNMGGFAADEIHLWLNEIPRSAAHTRPASGSALGGGQLQVEPDRMLATGQVRINATQFEGRTGRLEVWFRTPAPVTNASQSGAGTPADASSSPISSPSHPLAAGDKTKPPTQKFHLLGDVVRIQLLREGEATSVEEVSVDGRVKLWDEPLAVAGAAAAPQPQLVITGDALQLRGGMESNAVVRVLGEPATITAQGMTLRGANVHLHRGDNRLWIEGPGDMQLPLATDLSGQKLDRATNVLVAWQEGLEFDGAVAHFAGNVQVQTANQQQWARSGSLDVTLSERVNFSQAKPGAKPQVAKIAFEGHFALENRSLDKQNRLASIEKMEAESLRIDQVSGRMEADGPGWVSTVRLGGAANPLASRVPGSAPPPAAPHNGPPQFSYLFVEFQLQIVGNLFQHQVEFQRNVRTIYGPVDGWQGTLDIDQRPEQLNEQTVLMECQRLELREMPGSFPDTTTLEMEATGDTVVEGKGFTARAARIGYQDEKQLLILEGDGRQDAELTRQTRIGGPQSHMKARKIMYWKFDNRVEVDDARMLDLNQLNDLRPR